MRFDRVIIGGGLAGLVAGVSVLRHGGTCAIVNAGQGALHFSSGSFEFCNALPDGAPVAHPLLSLPALIKAAPDHPYALLGETAVHELALEAEALFRSLGISLHGSVTRGNHLRLTPLGTLAPAWLSAEDACAVPMREDGSPKWPWKRILLAHIKGYLDSQPETLAHGLRSAGLEVECTEIALPELELRRKNASEFRSVNIARVLDKQENTAALAEALRGPAATVDAVLLPACIGLRESFSGRLDPLVGKPVRLVPTMPPSLLGARMSNALAEAFVRRGGIFMPGDRVVGYDAAPDGRILGVYTKNLEDDPLSANSFLLATGGFFSKGLSAGSDSIREPVFGLDLAEYSHKRETWATDAFFDSQPFLKFGVKTDAAMHGYKDGKPVPNLHVAGLILGNADPLAIGCGAGVAVVSALAAVNAMSRSGKAGGESV